MVTDFIRDCKYNIGSLKNFIYLTNADTINSWNYHIDRDDTTGEIRKAPSVVYKVYGKVNLNQQESLDGRLKFNSTVTVENHLNDIVGFKQLCSIIKEHKKMYVVVEDLEGTQYIQSVEFPSEFSYEMTVSNDSFEANSIIMSFKCDSNFPVMKMEEKISDDISFFEGCLYSGGYAENLRINEKAYTMVSKDNSYETVNLITTVNDGMKRVDFLKNSFSYKETYSSNGYAKELVFSIPMSAYKDYWSYKLAEFKANRYVATFVVGDNSFLVGDEFGLQPSYVLQTSESASALNLMTITMKEDSNVSFVHKGGAIPTNSDTSTTIKPLTYYNGQKTVFCDGVMGFYTLLAEVNAIGNATGNYYVLEGYEDNYPNTNIVGTFKLTDRYPFPLTFESNECKSEKQCAFNDDLPSNVEFYDYQQEVTFNVMSECDWQFVNLDGAYFTLDRTSGTAGIVYTVKATAQPVEYTTRHTAYIVTEGSTRTVNFTYMKMKLMGLGITPTSYDIDRNSHILEGYTDTEGLTYTVTGAEGVVISIDGKKITYEIPENPTEADREIVVHFMDSFGMKSQNVTITQRGQYSEWRKVEGYLCSEGNKVERERRYTGRTPDDINTPTEDYRAGAVIEPNSSDCQSVSKRWVDSGSTTCENGNLYSIMYEEESYNGGQTWQRNGNVNKILVEEQSTECDDSGCEWVWDGTTTICNNSKKYQYLEKVCDGVHSSQYKQGTEIADTTGECVEEFEWVDIDKTWCDGYSEYKMQQKRVKRNGIWTMVDEYNYTNILVKELSTSCGWNQDATLEYSWQPVYGEYLCDSDGPDPGPDPEPVENCDWRIKWQNDTYGFKVTYGAPSFDVKTASEIPSICDGEEFTTLKQLFKGMGNLVNAPNFAYNKDREYDMSEMYYGCSYLKDIADNVKSDKIKVVNAYNAFAYCASLVSLDLSGWDVSRLDTQSMYSGLQGTFTGCGGLEELNVSGWSLPHNWTSTNAFSGCRRLEKVICIGCDNDTVTILQNLMRSSGLDVSKITFER